MSYTMDFEDGGKITKEDTIMEYEGFRLVSDAMSLLYLFGKPCRSYLHIKSQMSTHVSRQKRIHSRASTVKLSPICFPGA